MFRSFVIFILFGLIVWIVRGYGRKNEAEPTARELVRDALTGIYFPKHEAVIITRSGETFYFISVENRDKYLTMHR